MKKFTVLFETKIHQSGSVYIAGKVIGLERICRGGK
jgi:hypothetical protein